MFQIVNNKIYITRGESAVYSREIRRNDKEKSPFIFPDYTTVSGGKAVSYNVPSILFSVKRNMYSKEKTLDYEVLLYPTTIIKALRNSSYTPSSSNFLKNYDGTSLTPESGALYVVLSTGNYYKSIYRYNGSSYEQVFDYLPQLLSQEIQDIPVNNFTPVHGVLYRTYNQGIPEYRYYKDNLTQYLQYNPTINITISSEDTMELIPGTYYYEISVVYKNESGEILHKITLLEPTEFIIGGSNINE